MTSLDGTERAGEVRKLLATKQSLRRLYEETYDRYRQCLDRCPDSGRVVELGSGGGFAKQALSELTTTDVVAYPEVDRQLDGMAMDLDDRSVRALFLLNVFHHIPDVERFFAEARRVLVDRGRLLIVDQYPGWHAKFILEHIHHEDFDMKARSWCLEGAGPLSGANGALAWIVFFRDRARFEALFPELRIDTIRLHTPLRYWLAGGLKNWSLLPGWLFRTATGFDRFLVVLSHRFASFVDIEIVREPREP